MLLRRFTKHVSDQNWFAVGLDVVVVIAGIFLGLQISDWKSKQDDAVLEQQYIKRLTSDMRTQIEQMGARTNYFIVSHADNELTVRWVTDPDSTSETPARIVSAFYNSSMIYPFDLFNITYQELLSTGNINILRDIKLRELLATYYYDTEPLIIAWNIDANNPYRNVVRSIIPADIQAKIVEACEPADGNTLSLISDCAAEILPDNSADILNEISSIIDIKRTSILNLSKLTIALRLYKNNTDTAKIVLDYLESR